MSTSGKEYIKQGQDFASQAADQAQELGERGIAAARDTAQQVYDYAKKNPANALLIAAAAGALLLAVLKVLSPSRD